MNVLTCYECSTTGTAYAMTGKRLLRGYDGGSLLGPSVFRYRVIGWFHAPADETEVLFCSRKCFASFLERRYYGHLNLCTECNFDRDCFVCEVDDGSLLPVDHACNCPVGPGTLYAEAGWGYHIRKRIQRLKERDAT